MDRPTVIGWLSVLILLVTVTSGATFRGPEIPLRQSLDSLPFAVGDWWGDRAEFTVGDLALNGSDDRLFRVYRHDGREIRLAIAYWRRQDAGDRVYTVMNAAPSDRWRMAARSTDPMPMESSRERAMNHLVFQHEGTGDRELVHYYYVQAGRSVHREMHGKLFTLLDAATRRRSDAALIRLASPLTRASGLETVERDHHAFLGHLIPLVDERLPP